MVGQRNLVPSLGGQGVSARSHSSAKKKKKKKEGCVDDSRLLSQLAEKGGHDTSKFGNTTTGKNPANAFFGDTSRPISGPFRIRAVRSRGLLNEVIRPGKVAGWPFGGDRFPLRGTHTQLVSFLGKRLCFTTRPCEAKAYFDQCTTEKRCRGCSESSQICEYLPDVGSVRL
ncbi:hypothetical protein LY78DRAFT_34814 [Colletotrichum sublineola]|nr:hypothetical protein LY78DRAFT_34814 [Colletotrichum sublineola]